MKLKTKEDWKCIKIDRYKFKGFKRSYLSRRLVQSGLVIREGLEDKRYWYIENSLNIMYGTTGEIFKNYWFKELLPKHLPCIFLKLK